MDKETLLKKLYENEEHYWGAPAQGFILDWFLAYWELHNMVCEHLGEEGYQTPLIERRKYELDKKAKGGHN